MENNCYYQHCPLYLLLLQLLDDGFEGITPEEWNEMLDKVELNDPSQLEVAAVVSGKMAKQDSPSANEDILAQIFDNSTNEENNDTSFDEQKFPRTGYEQHVYEDTTVATETSFKLLTFDGMKFLERSKSLSKRYVSLFILFKQVKLIELNRNMRSKYFYCEIAEIHLFVSAFH